MDGGLRDTLPSGVVNDILWSIVLAARRTKAMLPDLILFKPNWTISLEITGRDSTLDNLISGGAGEPIHTLAEVEMTA